VANTAWRDLFDDAKVYHLISSRSDHCPVLIELRKDTWDQQVQRVFRYEIMWERVDTFSEEIKKVWCSSADRQNLGGVANVLRNMRQALRHWSRENFGAVTNQLNGLRQKLEELKYV
jgi:hypothetical protein